MEDITYVVEIPIEEDDETLNFTHVVTTQNGSEYIKNQIKNEIEKYLLKVKKVKSSLLYKIPFIFPNYFDKEIDKIDTVFNIDGYTFDIYNWLCEFDDLNEIEINVYKLEEWVTIKNNYCKRLTHQFPQN